MIDTAKIKHINELIINQKERCKVPGNPRNDLTILGGLYMLLDKLEEESLDV